MSYWLDEEEYKVFWGNEKKLVQRQKNILACRFFGIVWEFGMETTLWYSKNACDGVLAMRRE